MARQVMINVLAEKNALTFLRQGPGLSKDYVTWVEARGYEDAPEIDGPAMGESW